MNFNLLGYAFCRVWQGQTFALASRFDDSTPLMASFWICAALASISAALFLPTRPSRRSARAWLLSAASVCSVVSIPVLLLGSAYVIRPVFDVGLVLSGMGLSTSWILWADRYMALAPRQIFIYTALSTAVMIALNIIGNAIPGSQYTSELLVALSPIASLIMLLRDWKSDGSWSGEGGWANQAYVPHKNLLGLGAAMLMFPFAYHVSMGTLVADASLLGRDLGDIVSLVIFAAVIAVSRESTGLLTVYRIATPLILCGFFLCVAIPDQQALFVSLFAGGGFKLGSLFFWVLLLMVAPSTKYRWAALGGCMAAKFTGNAGAILLNAWDIQETLGDRGSSILLAAIATVLLTLVFWTLPSRVEAAALIAAETLQAQTNRVLTLKEACELLARKKNLTERESEVFELLAQGRNKNAIASILSVGKGTVHTHILNVYNKLDIHSQQELIEFVIEYQVNGAIPDG